MSSDRVYHKCPSCGKVSYFAKGQPLVCKQCGAKAAPQASGTLPDRYRQPEGAATPASAPSADEDAASRATILGAFSLGLAILSFFMIPMGPLALVVALAGLGTGIGATMQSGPGTDPGRVMGIIGIVIASLMILFIFMILACIFGCETYTSGGSSYEAGDSGGSSSGNGGGGGGSSGGGEGNPSQPSGPGGGSSGGGGGGGAGGGVDVDVAPSVDAPVPWLPALLVPLALAWRCRQ